MNLHFDVHTFTCGVSSIRSVKDENSLYNFNYQLIVPILFIFLFCIYAPDLCFMEASKGINIITIKTKISVDAMSSMARTKTEK